MINDIWKYKKYIFVNAIGEIKYKYAGSGMGFFWNVLNPLFQILVYSFVFSNIMLAKMPGLEFNGAFTLYLCSGLLGWLSFSEIINRGVNSFVENSPYLKKLPIPASVFVAQTVVSSLISASISYLVLAVFVLFIYGSITFLWILIPFILILFFLFGFGLALLLATLNVFFRDLVQVTGVIVTLWLWLTPIVYVKDIIPSELQGVFIYNPVIPYVESLQQIIVMGEAPNPSVWLGMVLISVVSLGLGGITLSKFGKEIRDYI